MRGEPGPVGRQPLLGQDVEGDEEPVEQVVEGPVEQARPMGPDPAQLIGQRARRRGGRLAQELDQRAAVGSEAGSVGEEPVERLRDGGERPALADRAQVDELAERLDGAVLVEGRQQEELRDRGRWIGWLGDREPGRELRRERRDRLVHRRVAEAFPEPAVGRDDRFRIGLGPVAIDDPAEDRDEQPGRVELARRQRLGVVGHHGRDAGSGGHRAGDHRSATGVDPGGDRPRRRQVGREGEVGQEVARPGEPGQPEIVGGRATPGHDQPVVAPDPAPTGVRSACARSMARRSSSSPDGSNS